MDEITNWLTGGTTDLWDISSYYTEDASFKKSTIKEQLLKATGLWVVVPTEVEIDADVTNLSLEAFKAKYLPYLDVNFEI